MGPFPARGVCACCKALRCPGGSLSGSGRSGWGSPGAVGYGVKVFGFCSLLPTLEFSAGQKAGERLVLVPAWEVERCLSKTNAEERTGLVTPCLSSKVPALGLGSETFSLAGWAYGFEKITVGRKGKIVDVPSSWSSPPLGLFLFSKMVFGIDV